MARRFDVVAYLKLFRFPLVFTAIADSAAGYMISAGSTIELPPMAFLAVASAGLYCFGMALNDIADAARDREIAPTRVIPSGRITMTGARVAAGLAALLSLGCAGAAGRNLLLQTVLVWGAAVVAIVAYNCFLKVPPIMGLVRLCNFMLGIAVASRMSLEGSYAPLWACLIVALPHFVYVTALTYVSTLEEGEVDRRRVKFGAGAMMIAALAASSWKQLADSIWRFKNGQSAAPIEHAPWLAVGCSAVLALWVFFRAKNARDKRGVMLVVRDGIGGLILLDAALLISFNAPRLGWAHAQALGLLCLLIPAALSIAIFKRLA